ncbi:MAG TPA: hypothetical protein VGO72_05455, partial [Herminiimonas sp.]|nr:hypothetical protein [Herminiimonas sp.]
MAGHNHDHEHDHSHEHLHETKADACCTPAPVAIKITAISRKQKPAIDLPSCCADDTCTSEPAAFSDISVTNAQSVRYTITNMDCPTEERLIRNKLDGMIGIVRLDFNLMNRVLTVHHQRDSLDAVTDALTSIGMQAKLVEEDQPNDHDVPTLSSTQKMLLVTSGVAAAVAEALAWTSHTDSSPLVIALALLSIATG